MKSLAEIRADASDRLRPRQHYARNVIWGAARWSGSDLMGRARTWSGSYAIQRREARAAFLAAGGVLIAIEKGLIVGAAPAGERDGRPVYETDFGLVIETSPGRAKRLGS